MSHPLFEKHKETLSQAVAAIESRGYWSPYPESPRAYGENAIEAGRAAFDAYRNAQFYLDQPGVVDRGGAEVSPYGLPLNITYPRCRPEALIAAAKSAMSGWIKAGPDTRAGVCLEILARLNAGSMEMAHAVMHTTGQALMMAFQAAGPHAQDRVVEPGAEPQLRQTLEVRHGAVLEQRLYGQKLEVVGPRDGRGQGLQGRRRVDEPGGYIVDQLEH
jgi:hypothetical protein